MLREPRCGTREVGALLLVVGNAAGAQQATVKSGTATAPVTLGVAPSAGTNPTPAAGPSYTAGRFELTFAFPTGGNQTIPVSLVSTPTTADLAVMNGGLRGPSAQLTQQNTPLVVTMDAQAARIVTAWSQALQQAQVSGAAIVLDVCDYDYNLRMRDTYSGAQLARLAPRPGTKLFDATFTYGAVRHSTPLGAHCVVPPKYR